MARQDSGLHHDRRHGATSLKAEAGGAPAAAHIGKVGRGSWVCSRWHVHVLYTVTAGLQLIASQPTRVLTRCQYHMMPLWEATNFFICGQNLAVVVCICHTGDMPHMHLCGSLQAGLPCPDACTASRATAHGGHIRPRLASEEVLE